LDKGENSGKRKDFFRLQKKKFFRSYGRTDKTEEKGQLFPVLRGNPHQISGGGKKTHLRGRNFRATEVPRGRSKGQRRKKPRPRNRVNAEKSMKEGTPLCGGEEGRKKNLWGGEKVDP